MKIRSISVKCDKYVSFLSSLDHNFVVSCLTESTLKEGEQAGEYFKKYKTLYSGLSNRQCKSVIVCMPENFDCDRTPQFNTNLSFIEIVTIKNKLSNKHFIVL